METELPGVLDALRAAGGLDHNVLHHRPASADRRLAPRRRAVRDVTARRPVLEAAVAAAAGATARACGSAAACRHRAGDVGRRPAVPQVVGVRTDGRRRRRRPRRRRGRPALGVGRWIVDGRRPALRSRSGRTAGSSTTGGTTAARMPAGVDSILTHNESVSLLTLPADNGTWGVGITTSSRDRALRALRHVPCWEAAMRCYPAAAQWIDARADHRDLGDGRHRGPAAAAASSTATPVVTGLVAVGDAWACTNPSLGRGASIGALHACVLRDVSREEGTADPDALVLRFDDGDRGDGRPLYLDSTLSFDRHRLAEIEADIAGVPYEPDDPAWAMTTRAGRRRRATDPVVARALAAIAAVQALPAQALGDPAVLGRVAATWAGRTTRPARTGPSCSPRVARRGVEPVMRDRRRRRRAGGVQGAAADRRCCCCTAGPTTHELWRHQVAALTAAGYRTIAPDLRGFGASRQARRRRRRTACRTSSATCSACWTALGVGEAHVVGHDWGAALGWGSPRSPRTGSTSLAALSVGHPAAFRDAGFAQREKSWYMLLFQFEGVAEQWLSARRLREPPRVVAATRTSTTVIAGWPTPGALTAASGCTGPSLPPASLVGAAAGAAAGHRAGARASGAAGTWLLIEEQMTGSGDVRRPGRGATSGSRAPGTGCSSTRPDEVNALLLDFLTRSLAGV